MVILYGAMALSILVLIWAIYMFVAWARAGFPDRFRS